MLSHLHICALKCFQTLTLLSCSNSLVLLSLFFALISLFSLWIGLNFLFGWFHGPKNMFITYSEPCLFWDVISFISASVLSIFTKLFAIGHTRFLMCVPTYQYFHFRKTLTDMSMWSCSLSNSKERLKKKITTSWLLIMDTRWKLIFIISRTISLIYIWTKWAGWLKPQRRNQFIRCIFFLVILGMEISLGILMCQV